MVVRDTYIIWNQLHCIVHLEGMFKIMVLLCLLITEFMARELCSVVIFFIAFIYCIRKVDMMFIWIWALNVHKIISTEFCTQLCLSKHCFQFLLLDNPKETTRVSVFVRILDVNDNAPQFAVFYDTFVCENARPGQVSNSTTSIQDDPVVWKMCFG